METQEQRRERLSERMDERGAEWACAWLGLADEFRPFFTGQSRGAALRHFLELNQLPAHMRERDLMERNGSDGRVKA
ncbi:MAG: hypothetical protein M3R38_27050 [Actinomycetota bacterium]|nr:hypothetical protein [Actinomycetota bacterium]